MTNRYWTYHWVNPNKTSYCRYGLHGSWLGDAPRVAVGEIVTYFGRYDVKNYLITRIDPVNKLVELTLNAR